MHENQRNSFIFRIAGYATTSTSENVLIIGGYTNDSQFISSTVAEYIGKILETWLKLDMLMAQSPQDLSQWLLVVNQIVEDRKCVSGSNYSVILIFKYEYGAVGFRLFGKPNH